MDKYKYKYYIKNTDTGRDFTASLLHVKDHAYSNRREEDIAESLLFIEKRMGNPFACMKYIGDRFIADASLNLLIDNNEVAFKKNSYITAKLFLMYRIGDGKGNKFELADTYAKEALLFSILSDCKKIQEYWRKYGTELLSNYFYVNVIYASFFGDWDLLRQSLDKWKRYKNSSKVNLETLSYHFFSALLGGKIETIEHALNSFIVPKENIELISGYDVYFDFYLHIYLIVYTKIAIKHGYEVHVNHPVAPLSLILLEPLDDSEYKDPYSFMEEFDFTISPREWKHNWEERMEIAKATNIKKSWLSRFLTRN